MNDFTESEAVPTGYFGLVSGVKTIFWTGFKRETIH
jgi:hypothetical protein